MRKEEDLDGQGEAEVKRDDDDEENLARLVVRSTQHRVKVSQKESDRHATANSDEHPVENVDGRPTDESDRNPNEIGIAIEGPAFKEVCRLGPEVT